MNILRVLSCLNGGHRSGAKQPPSCTCSKKEKDKGLYGPGWSVQTQLLIHYRKASGDNYTLFLLLLLLCPLGQIEWYRRAYVAQFGKWNLCVRAAMKRGTAAAPLCNLCPSNDPPCLAFALCVCCPYKTIRSRGKRFFPMDSGGQEAFRGEKQ